MGVSLLTVPAYIRLIGDARYGVLTMVWLVVGYFGLFDLGLGRAAAQRIAALSSSASKEIASTFWTALFINGILGIVGGLIIWPVSIYIFNHLVTVESPLRPELNAAIPWFVLAVPLATLSGVLTGALTGRAQFLELNIISVIGSVSAQIFPLAFAWRLGPDLAWLVPTIIVTRFVTLVLLFSRCYTHVFRAYWPSFSWDDARNLLLFGGWVTVTSLISPLVVSLDRFVIGGTLGAEAVTYYAVPYRLASSVLILPQSMASALFPRLAQSNSVDSQKLAILSIRSLSALMTPLMSMALLLIDPIIRLWIGPTFASNVNFTAQVFLLGFWVNGLAQVPAGQLQASGRPDIITKCLFIELIPYWVLLFLGMHFWGLAGAAVALCLRLFIECGLFMWFAGTLISGIGLLKAPIVFLLSSLVVALTLPFGSPLWWLAATCILLMTLASSWSSAPVEMRQIGIRSVTQIFSHAQEVPR